MRTKSTDKENAILDAAISTFAQNGYAETQVAAIAKQAGLATGSIYLYFKSKEELLWAIFDRMWLSVLDKMQDQQSKALISEPKVQLESQFCVYFDHLLAHSDLAKLYLHEHHRYLKHSQSNGYLAYQECIKMGEIAYKKLYKMNSHHTFDISLARAFLFGGVRAALEYNLENPHKNAVKLRKQMLHLALGVIQIQPSQD